ncbi:hypothetical protein [Paenibacillus sp. LK1]|uniref:hypothetical protein n=1 Tax=Paenibacillus sp. LK1 TaxID=2053014 RepID=UPI000C19EF10|nr:hypothetical protein [Paenibacillus sp. LK1]PIH61536.1 hypothetical protein CS562_03770 [Paenibacillus sp. LK1]
MTKSQYNAKFLDKSNWSLIKNGWVFEAIVPYVGERPLDFFIPDNKSKFRGTTTGTRKVKGPRKGTNIATTENFSRGGEFEIVLTAKTRKIVVLSNDDLDNSLGHGTVMIAKIVSVDEHEKEEEWYKLTVEGSHPFFVHLDEAFTGKECFIDMASITTIHKNLLFEEKFFLGNNIMMNVTSKLDYLMNLGFYRHSIAVGNASGISGMPSIVRGNASS